MNALQNKRSLAADTDRQRASAMRLLEEEMGIILSAEIHNAAREFRELGRSLCRRGSEFSGSSLASC